MSNNKYPCISFDTTKLSDNIKTIIKKTMEYRCVPIFVTKGFCANEDIVNLIYKNGGRWVGDSRILNLKKITSMSLEFDKKVLLRIPMQSELEDVIEYADISFESEYKTIERLSKIAYSKRKKHDIVLMIEQGDLREGILKEDVHRIFHDIKKLKNINIVGIGSNLTCLNGILPSIQTIGELECLYIDLQKKGSNLNLLSYGNSSMLGFLKDVDKKLNGIKNIRVGESFLMGIDTTTRRDCKWLNQNNFTFSAQIVELKKKPSKPWGEISYDGYGNVVKHKDEGVRTRAILGFGRQDVDIRFITPKDPHVTLIGQNSDHTLLDVTNGEYILGDIVEFDMNYQGLLMCMTSEYVYKNFKGGNNV